MDENPEKTPSGNLTGKEKSLANLKPPWSSDNQPENSGRKKGSLSLVTLMKKLASMQVHGVDGAVVEIIKKMYGEDAVEAVTNAHAYIARIHEAAMKGEEWALKIELAYIDGMPKQFIDHTTKDKEIKQAPIFQIVDNEHGELIKKLMEKDNEDQIHVDTQAKP